ncbi:MAG: hypothetical protein P8Y71_14425 [Pseudolabrys sp.]
MDGSKAFRGARRWRHLSRASGEPFIFGFDPGALAGVWQSHGYLLHSDASTAQIAQQYCPSLGRSETGNRAYRVATARYVDGQNETTKFEGDLVY